MTGWNLPPGCNVGDIPGNRPEDIQREQLFEAFEQWLDGLCPYKLTTVKQLFEALDPLKK